MLSKYTCDTFVCSIVDEYLFIDRDFDACYYNNHYTIVWFGGVFMDNKKRILLINSSLDLGGIEVSIVNMANELCKEHSVDLFLYKPDGVMKSRLDPRVNVLKSNCIFRAMAMCYTYGCIFLEKNFVGLAFALLSNLWINLFDNRLPIFLVTLFKKKLVGYDLAVAFRQEDHKKSLASGYVRFLDRCVEAKKKIAWIHCDASFYPEDQEFNKKYYKNVDKIVGVSESVMKIYKRVNPQYADKTDYCYNFFNYDTIREKANELPKIKYEEGKFICFSASRLDEEKGIERTITAIAPILKEHSDVVWYIAGAGGSENDIKQLIKQEKLEKQVFLLGMLENPYPYMKNADLFMLNSYQEAAPMVYNEVKSLGTPIFSTKTSSSYEMLNDGVEDFICENSEEGIREKFSEIINNRDMVTQARNNLKSVKLNNDSSIAKINSWLSED